VAVDTGVTVLRSCWADRLGVGGDTIDPVGVLERDQILEQLNGLLAEASWRRGHLVLVRGEAGIGKSTLVEAFAAGRSGRVLWGMCDPVVPPRPLGPIFDIADQVGGELRSALADPDRHRILSAFLGLLRAEGGPWVVVLEDMQWADEATLEVLRVVGRRAAQLRALVIATFRDEEIGPGHPLSVALGDIPAASTVSVVLEPLSVAAVGALAAGTAIDPIALHRATAGNPFFVTEVVASGGAELPSTVREAVWARARRLPAPGLQVVRAASVLGSRCDTEVLCAVSATTSEAIDGCVAGGILRRDQLTIEFRHELSRRAVLESLAPSERSRLHQRALAALRQHAPSTAPGELAGHAVEAGDANAVLELAPKAAARAAALGAHRAALAHYDNALPYAARLPASERASLLAAHAHECRVTDAIKRAVASQQEALDCWRELGDLGAEGRALSDLAECLWWNGETDRALSAAEDAVELLESNPADVNVAGAYARLAQVSMMSGRYAIASDWGRKAVALGELFGEEGVVVHALNTLGVAEVCLGVDGGLAKLEESLRRATVADLEEGIDRAFNNLIATTRENRLYELFDLYSQQAGVFFDEHDLDASEHCLIGDIVDGLFERGRWSEAACQARVVVERGSVHGRVQCLAVLGRKAARRGEPEAFRWLDEALELQNLYGGELTYPLRAARAEAAWLAGNPRAAAGEIESGLPAFDERTNPWLLGEFAFWAHKIGVDWDCPARPADPYAYYLDGQPEKAAAAWATLGCPYDEAQALADSDDQTQLRRALSIFQSLEATPAARVVTERLRAMGARRISRGSRPTTRANPAGLTDREVQVLLLLADGLRNSEIAERLVVSTRTVDHHVSAALTKLGVRSRYEAGQKAISLRLKGP
jgi:DNA-binding CsgD family transcriptional regulator/tetratricopeptide (TPR) repeat protein